MATAEDDDESVGSLSDEDIFDDPLQNDTWVEELECALLAECDPAHLKKIVDGKQIPSNLRPDYWKALLALNDVDKVILNCEYDLVNQLEIRNDCEKLLEHIATNIATEPLTDDVRMRLMSDFETTITTYVKARPELGYTSDNGWTDILQVLYHLQLDNTQLYLMFFRIVDRYIPKDLSYKSSMQQQQALTTNPASNSNYGDNSSRSTNKHLSRNQQHHDEMRNMGKSTQAYHLLRLLIQYHDPELCSILDSRKITPNLYVKDWFCSLFARNCSPKLSLLIWDTHFKMADPFLIFFAAIVMVVNASDELKKNNLAQSEMLKVLQAMPSQLMEEDIEDLYYLVSNHYTNSTPRSIRSYSHLFFLDTFGNTYLGNESPEDGQPLLDLRTTKLTNSLDLSQYLCLPIVPAEIFSLDTAQLRSSPTQSQSSMRYFLVDCRPSEQYNAGHLTKAFHLDCSLMLREPSSFAAAVQALLAIQRQVVASKSNAGGQHLCFIGSGQEEEDQYVNMVVASFLQKYQKYVSIAIGGYSAIHNYISTKSELKDLFDKYIIDHNPALCKACHSGQSEWSEGGKFAESSAPATNTNPTQSLFASTTSFLRGDKISLSGNALKKLASNPQAATAANLLAQSGASMLDKFTTAFVSKSNVFKDLLVESLSATVIPSSTISSSTRGHVSSQDRLGKRYTGSNLRYAIDETDDNDTNKPDGDEMFDEPSQEIQVDVWQKQTKIIVFSKCTQIKGSVKYPGYIALTSTHLWILREIAHNKGFASIVAKRPLDMIVRITSKRRQPDLIIFRYGYSNNQRFANDSRMSDKDETQSSGKCSLSVVASDQLHIPQHFEVMRLIKREISRIMDESALNNTNVGITSATTASDQQQSINETALSFSDSTSGPIQAR